MNPLCKSKRQYASICAMVCLLFTGGICGVSSLSLANPTNHRKRVPLCQRNLAMKFYCRGFAVKAKAIFLHAGQTKLSTQVSLLLKSFRLGRRACANFNPKRAIPHLTNALDIDIQLSDGKSIYARQLRLMLAYMHFTRGRVAISMRKERGYPEAYKDYRKALTYNRRHTASRLGLWKMRKVARGWLQQALKTKDKAKARRILRRIFRIVSPRDSIFKAADKHFVKIGS